MNTTTQSNRPLRSLAFCLGTVVAIMFAFALCRKLGVVDPEFAKRGAAVALGFVLIVAGNFLPKFRLFAPGENDYGRARASERLAGWTFVVAGLAFVFLWLVAPMRSAMLISPLVGLTAFAMVAVHWAQQARQLRLCTEEQNDPDSPRMTKPLVGNLVILQILFAIMCTFLIFLSDAIWGDRVTQWLAVAFALTLPLLALPLSAQLTRPKTTS